MGRVFIPAQDAKTVPVVRSGVFDIDETFIKGAVLGLNEDGELVEIPDVDAIEGNVVGVALEDVYSKPGWNVANDDKVAWRTGVAREVSMVDLVKQPIQVFSGRLTTEAGVDVTPTQTMIGETRGILKLGNGEWVVNNDDEENETVIIVDIVLLEGSAAAGTYILFKFHPDAIGIEPIVPEEIL